MHWPRKASLRRWYTPVMEGMRKWSVSNWVRGSQTGVSVHKACDAWAPVGWWGKSSWCAWSWAGVGHEVRQSWRAVSCKAPIDYISVCIWLRLKKLVPFQLSKSISFSLWDPHVHHDRLPISLRSTRLGWKNDFLKFEGFDPWDEIPLPYTIILRHNNYFRKFITCTRSLIALQSSIKFSAHSRVRSFRNFLVTGLTHLPKLQKIPVIC